MIAQLDPADLSAWRADASRAQPLILDVREPWEFEHCRIDGSLLCPLEELPQRVGALARDRDVVTVCHHGVRSWFAATFLHRAGFARVHNLRGGVEAWAAEVDPAMPRY